jgi:hypothetical protein
MMTNPALADLAPLNGQWRMGAVRGGPSGLTLRLVWADPSGSIGSKTGLPSLFARATGGPPAAVWIIGRDDSDPNFQVLDADSRGVSRVYHMSFAAPDWGMWRTTPEFAQHFEAVIAVEGRRISGAWT